MRDGSALEDSSAKVRSRRSAARLHAAPGKGYFAAPSGDVTDDVIKKYIELQGG